MTYGQRLLAPPKEEPRPESGKPAQEESFKWTAKEFIIATLKRRLPGHVCRKLEDRCILGSRTHTCISTCTSNRRGAGGKAWWTNGYTAQWDENSPLFLAGLMALLGSGIGVAMAILTKLPTAEIKLGLHGFNQVLVMIALTSFILTPQSFMMAVFATIGCSFLMPALQRFFGQWGLPALTGPFVFTAWVFMLAVVAFRISLQELAGRGHRQNHPPPFLLSYSARGGYAERGWTRDFLINS